MTPISVGTQLVAPEGFESLDKNNTYHMLCSSPQRDRVLLVHFFVQERKRSKKGRKKQLSELVPGVHLYILRRSAFEGALRSHLIKPADKQERLPPWLLHLGSKSVEGLEAKRQKRQAKPARSNLERLNERIALVDSILADKNEFLLADNPFAALNRIASKRGKNQQRLRVVVLVRLCFQGNDRSLYPAFGRIGRWSRAEHVGKRLGRQSLIRGVHTGYILSPTDRTKCVKCYRQFRKRGRSFIDIYSRSMTKLFGCIVTGKGRNRRFSHPDGAPFPSFDQFRRAVYAVIPIEDVHNALYGAVRTRTKKRSSIGRFSEAVAHFVERIESDGYYTEEIPLGGKHGLCVVHAVCVASGMRVAIGFCEGKEKGVAYRMMLFCMAIGKVRFCALFGIDIDADEWFGEGLGGYSITDRGPGAKRNLVEDLEARPAISDKAPSWQGQSKATVESGNPRNVRFEGEPTYFQSGLTAYQLACREIFKLLEHNENSDATRRMTPEMLENGGAPTPNGIVEFLLERGRNDARPVDFDDAVRWFLTPVELTIGTDGLYLEGQRYDSKLLRETGILDRTSKGQNLHVTGYVMEVAVRYIWADIGGEIVQLEGQLPLRDDENQLFASFGELRRMGELRKTLRSELRLCKPAVAAEYRERFRQLTGKDYEAGSRRKGRPRPDRPKPAEVIEIGESSEAANDELV